MKIYRTFKDVQMIPKECFDISTGFRFSKLHFGSVPSIPVAVLGSTNVLDDPQMRQKFCSRGGGRTLFNTAVRVVEFSSGGYKIKNIFA